MVSETIINAAPENELIRNTMKKADLLLNSYKNPICSILGCLLQRRQRTPDGFPAGR